VKVIERTDRLLVLEDRPWLIGLLMIGMALVFLGGGMAMIAKGEILGGLVMTLLGAGVPLLLAALLVRRVRLTLDRGTGQITRVSRSVRGLERTGHALSRLTAARLDASTDSDGTTYRLELVLTDPPETLPFTSYYTSGSRPQRLCDAVNGWLEGQGARGRAAPGAS
jgi:hypothetical protein